MAPSIRLIYFDDRARGEITRILLDYGDIKYEDRRIPDEEWPNHKESMPFGQIPVLEVDGQLYAQSKAIARYVANEVKLAGKNSLENMEIDGVVDLVGGMEDLLIEYLYFEPDEKRKESLRVKLETEVIPYNCSKLDAIAEKNDGFLALKRLTWADVYYAGFYEYAGNSLKKEIFEKFKNLNRVIKNVVNDPKINAYLKKRPALKNYKFDLKDE